MKLIKKFECTENIDNLAEAELGEDLETGEMSLVSEIMKKYVKLSVEDREMVDMLIYRLSCS